MQARIPARIELWARESRPINDDKLYLSLSEDLPSTRPDQLNTLPAAHARTR